MNLFLEPPGFLGTGASLLADLTLIAYFLLIVPGMLAGYFSARRGHHRPHHKWLMVFVTLANWLLIIFLMWAAFTTDVVPNVSSRYRDLRYLMPVVHAVLGGPAQLLATFIVLRMLWEDYQVARAKKRGEADLQSYWFKSAKSTMRVTLILWLVVAGIGIASYFVRYDVIKLPRVGDAPPPVATQELEAPPSTEAARALPVENHRDSGQEAEQEADD